MMREGSLETYPDVNKRDDELFTVSIYKDLMITHSFYFTFKQEASSKVLADKVVMHTSMGDIHFKLFPKE